MSGGIYKITIEGVGTYYGETDNILRRWAMHKRLLRNGRHTNYRLKAAVKAVGLHKFTFTILETSAELTASKTLRLLRERLYIEADPQCLNIRDGHDQPVTPNKLPDRILYRNRILHIVRHHKSALVRIYDESNQLLGVESVSGKFRLGTFYSSQDCTLTRITRRNKSGPKTD